MIRLTIRWITAVLTRSLYLTVAAVLLLALLTTLERGIVYGKLLSADSEGKEELLVDC